MNYACRSSDGSMKPTYHGSRQQLYCPNCQFKYKENGCLFALNHAPVAFGATSRGKRGAHRTSNLTGGRWTAENILDRIVEYYERTGVWPTNTVAYRDSSSLPHSSTVVRHFGSIDEAIRQATVKQAKGLHEEEEEI